MTVSYESHPAAELFPLMSEEELESLADDIREHGLRQPIVLDGEGRILDGRNRLRACELAGVEPEFTNVNGADPVSLSLSLNLQRRNLTASQRAIVAAEAWGMFESGRGRPGKGGKSLQDFGNTRDRLKSLFGVNQVYIQQARALVENDPLATGEVKRGDTSLADAYARYSQRRLRSEKEQDDLDRLRALAPDLYERVQAEEVTLADALRQAEEREELARKSRYAATMNLIQGLRLLDQPAEPEHIARTVSLLDPGIEAQQGVTITAEGLQRVVRFAAALSLALEERGRA